MLIIWDLNPDMSCYKVNNQSSYTQLVMNLYVGGVRLRVSGKHWETMLKKLLKSMF